MAAPALLAFTPWLAMAAVGWLYYRRIRSQFGRQVYRARRAKVRIAVLSLVGCGLLYAAVVVPHVAPGVAIGVPIGVVLGIFALRHTHTGLVDGVPGYTPNPWIGSALSALLVGRLAWRFQDGVFSARHVDAAGAPQASPLTFACLAMLVAYALVHGAGLAGRMRALASATDRLPPAH